MNQNAIYPSTDTKLRLLQNGNELKAWFAHDRRIARLYSKRQNLERARRVREDQDWRGQHDG